MTMDRPAHYLVSLVRKLCEFTGESEWGDFKVNVRRPQEVDAYISALANSAALVGKAFAYVVWGISDRIHLVVGTDFDPNAVKVGNERQFASAPTTRLTDSKCAIGDNGWSCRGLFDKEPVHSLRMSHLERQQTYFQ